MALVLANRVQESATANTTVSFTLTGAVTGFQSFAVIGDTNTTYYSATDTTGQWEVGLGTYSTTGPTLTRTTIYASSNSGSAVTFSGTVSVFVTYPSGKSVNLDTSGNVSALGTVASGTWQGSTVGVAYGGTGVTASTGPNSVVLRDADGNIAGVNNVEVGLTFTTSAGGTTTLTAASTQIQILTGSANQTFRLPDATTLHVGVFYTLANGSSGVLTVTDYTGTVIETITQGGAAQALCLSAATVAGTWGFRVFASSNTTWGNAALDYPGSITSATWAGNTVQPGYGGTGLTTFTAANYALYSTSSSALTAGTLPVAAGGTGVTTSTGSGSVVLSSSPALTTPDLGTPSAATLTNATGLPLTTGVTGTLPIANGGTGQTTANTAFNALAPSQTSNSGKYLTTDGTNTSWGTISSGASISNDTSTATSVYPLFAAATSGTPTTIYTSNANLLYKPSIGEFSAKEVRSSNGIVINSQTVSSDYTIASGDNGLSAGPVTVNGGVTVTITSGCVWTVV